MYIFYPEGQYFVFIYSLLFGVILGIIYDIFKVKRIIFSCNNVILFFDDILYFLLSSVLLTIGIFNINNGNIRWYEILPCILGFVLERCTLSLLIMKIFIIIAKIIKRIIKLVLKFADFLFFPIRKLYTYLSYIFAKLLFNCYIRIYQRYSFNISKKLYRSLS